MSRKEAQRLIEKQGLVDGWVQDRHGSRKSSQHWTRSVISWAYYDQNLAHVRLRGSAESTKLLVPCHLVMHHVSVVHRANLLTLFICKVKIFCCRMFLIRESQQHSQCFVLSLCHKLKTKHYLIIPVRAHICFHMLTPGPIRKRVSLIIHTSHSWLAVSHLQCEDGGRKYYTMDDGLTLFIDLLQLVEFHQINKGILPVSLKHPCVCVALWRPSGLVSRSSRTAGSQRVITEVWGGGRCLIAPGRWRAHLRLPPAHSTLFLIHLHTPHLFTNMYLLVRKLMGSI